MSENEYRIKDLHIFVDGIEMEDIASECSIGPTGEEDNITPVKDITGKTVAVAITENDDGEGVIKLVQSSPSNAILRGFRDAKKPVQVAFTYDDPDATQWRKITLDECYFQRGATTPSAEGEIHEWKFKGRNYKEV
ncbi:MAG: hypothetical protein ACXQTR_02470 [Candidatus Methanospirareceae archaeon]